MALQVIKRQPLVISLGHMTYDCLIFNHHIKATLAPDDRTISETNWLEIFSVEKYIRIVCGGFGEHVVSCKKTLT